MGLIGTFSCLILILSILTTSEFLSRPDLALRHHTLIRFVIPMGIKTDLRRVIPQYHMPPVPDL